jgi:hypothetical protein
MDFVGELSGGVALRGGPIVFRVAVIPSLCGSDLFLAYGATLGCAIDLGARPRAKRW